MPNESPHLFVLATFFALWVFLYLYFRMRRLTKYLDERYWLLRLPATR